MYGLKTCGAILQAVSLIGGVLGILGGIASLALPYNRGGFDLLIVSISGAFSGYLLGAAAQAIAVIAENSDHQTRLLAKLAKELPPSNRQLKREIERVAGEPTYRKLERRAKDL